MYTEWSVYRVDCKQGGVYTGWSVECIQGEGGVYKRLHRMVGSIHVYALCMCVYHF